MLGLQDADGWRLVCAVRDWGSGAGRVVGDLTGECGRHVVVRAVVVLVVSGMELSRTEEG